MTQDHHDGTVRVHPLRHTEVVDAVVGYNVGQVVLWNKQTLSGRHSAGEGKYSQVKFIKTIWGSKRLCMTLHWTLSRIKIRTVIASHRRSEKHIFTSHQKLLCCRAV